jgi:hypothetical protein
MVPYRDNRFCVILAGKKITNIIQWVREKRSVFKINGKNE